MTNGFSILISSAVIINFGCCFIGRIPFIIASFVYTLPPAIVHDAFSIDLRSPLRWWRISTCAIDLHLLVWKLPLACLSSLLSKAFVSNMSPIFGDAHVLYRTDDARQIIAVAWIPSCTKTCSFTLICKLCYYKSCEVLNGSKNRSLF